MRNVKYAGIQMQCSRSVEENIAKADKMVREAAANGAQIILLPELFERQYFCQERNYDYYAYAQSVDDNPAVKHFQKVAAELKVVLPISFYERDINVFYNTVAVIDADGSVLGIYRKHIFLMTIIIRKSSISHREIQVLRCGIQDMRELEWEYAGISGFQRQPEEWRYREQKSFSIRQRLAQSQFLRLTVCLTGEDVCRDIQRAI